jgi:hypothetical protein
MSFLDSYRHLHKSFYDVQFSLMTLVVPPPRPREDTNLSMLKILQSTGLIELKPIRVNQRVLAVRGHWWHVGFEADPDLKRILVEEAERQQREQDQQRNEKVSVS